MPYRTEAQKKRNSYGMPYKEFNCSEALKHPDATYGERTHAVLEYIGFSLFFLAFCGILLFLACLAVVGVYQAFAHAPIWSSVGTAVVVIILGIPGYFHIKAQGSNNRA